MKFNMLFYVVVWGLVSILYCVLWFVASLFASLISLVLPMKVAEKYYNMIDQGSPTLGDPEYQKENIEE